MQLATPSPTATRTAAQRVLKTASSPKPLPAMVALLCLLFKSSLTSNISCSRYISPEAARCCLLQRFGPLRTGTLGNVVLSEKNRTEALGGQGKLQKTVKTVQQDPLERSHKRAALKQSVTRMSCLKVAPLICCPSFPRLQAGNCPNSLQPWTHTGLQHCTQALFIACHARHQNKT